MWVNLLPNGTRTVELCSAYALVLAAVLMFTGSLTAIPQLDSFESHATWASLLLIFGSLQLISIFFAPSLEILRVILSWVVGCFWTWISVTSVGVNLGVDDMAALFLGIGNFYGYIINYNLLHQSWKA